MSSEVETSLEISGSRRTPKFLDAARNDKAQQATRALFAHLTIYHDETPHSAAINMAIDEALLETAVVPSIRFYRWRSPALSFGYFGKFSDVATYAAERDLVRRWTRGGIALSKHAAASGYNCFANPVRADVMMNGRKIAGAAQRRTRRGLLQQGSIQGIVMKTDLAEKFAQALSVNCSEFEINERIFQRARELAQQKYGSDFWLGKR